MALPNTKKEMDDLLRQACSELRRNSPNVFLRTRYTRPTEWNIARSLAPEIKALLGLACGLTDDVDVSKHIVVHQSNSVRKKIVRPDIIFHLPHFTHRDFLVVEVKHNGSVAAVEKDASKIKTYFFPTPLDYKFGATINFRSNQPDEIEVYTNPRHRVPVR